VSVLTNVGLEHTRWLGPTVHDIAEEKLAVVREDTTLALGAQLAPEAMAVAERVARERGARVVIAPARSPGLELGARGEFQQRNFALARLAAEAYLESAGVQADMAAVRRAAAETQVRGRLQVLGEDPLTVLDGAHNPDAARALAQSLRGIAGGPHQPLALVLGVLEDKDAAGMLEPLLAISERAWFTAPPSGRALSPATLQSLARQMGFERVTCEARPLRALEQAQEWARGRGGAVLATGSVYLVGALLSELGAAGPAEESERSRRRSAL
jgi:dihydrofolate synthase/folylpolyglutamate synthase